MFIISLIHGLLCLFVLYLVAKDIRLNGASFYNLSLLVFIVFDSIGVAIAPYIPLNIPYIISQRFVINEIGIKTYLKQCTAHWFFIFISILFLEQGSKYYKYNKTALSIEKKWGFWSVVLFLIGVAFSYRYYVLGSGIDILLSTRLIYSSPAEAIQARTNAFYQSGFRQGAFLAQLGAYILFPLAAAFSLRSRRKMKYVFFSLCFLFSMIYGIQTRQKLPLIEIIIMYSYFILLKLDWLYQMRSNMSKKIVLIILFTILFIIVTALYGLNFGLSLSDSIKSTLYRSFLVPCATESNYFYVFPEASTFRGLQKIFSIELGKNQLKIDDVTIYDVALIATGDRFSSNASFLSVAWSGAGYFGVIVISIIFIIIAAHLLRLINKLDRYSRYATLVYGILGGFFLVNGAFISYIIGSLLPIIIIVLVDGIERMKIII